MKFTKKFIVSFSIIFLILLLSSFIFFKAGFRPPILMFDYSAQDKQKLSGMDKEIFVSQLKFLKEHNFRVVPLEELVRLSKEKKAYPKIVAITLDGGYSNNLEIAKILKTFDFPATFFVTVNNINKEGYLGEEDLRHIARMAPFSIGSGTLNNNNLALLSLFELEKEVFLSKKIIENIVEKEINAISYPLGQFNEDVLRAVENSGYICGVGLDREVGKNTFSLGRIKITNKDTAKDLKRKLSGYYHILKIFR